MISAPSPDKKQIAKNTFALYVRMLLSIFVGLYTSRVVLNVLGVSDYGVYNVVGGIVAMISFLNLALTAASQRFISFELGTGNKIRLAKVFSTSVTIHVLLAIILFIIAETIGLWFVNTHLNIETSRIEAANWVYHCSVLTLVVSVISVPYNSCIVAHEHMKTFAYIGILEVLLKLIIVYLLLVIHGDKLIMYALLVLAVSIIIRSIYSYYCKCHFEECVYHFVFDKQLFKDMFGFAGWSMLGNFGFSFKDQGSNIILNLFFGTAINAARGVAMQVNGVINHFSDSFMMAITPQITKQYAAGNIKESINLVYTGCRISFYLMAIISTPVLVNVDYLLTLWLGIVPQYTSEFLKLCLLSGMINAMSPPIVRALQATGHIAVFQIVICIIVLSELPITYYILSLGAKPYMAMFPTVVISLIALLVRFLLLKRNISICRFYYFAFFIVGKNLILLALGVFFSALICSLFDNSFMSFLLSSFISFFVMLICIYYLGLVHNERLFVNQKIRRIFSLHKNKICQ